MWVPYTCEVHRDVTKVGALLWNSPQCGRPAKFQAKEGFLICEGCLTILDQDPERITFPKPPFGILHQQKTTREVAEKIGKSSQNVFDKIKK